MNTTNPAPKKRRGWAWRTYDVPMSRPSQSVDEDARIPPSANPLRLRAPMPPKGAKRYGSR